MYKIISSGSDGNAVIYQDKVMVDCGVSFRSLAGHYLRLRVVLLTHEHGDHFNSTTIRKLGINNPNVIFAAPEYLISKLKTVVRQSQIMQVEVGQVYKIEDITISPIHLYHNVPNVGYRIMINGKKILHATDTHTLEGISAKQYDLYALEYNWDETTIQEFINEKKKQGIFAYEEDAIKNHLSFQKSLAFYEANKGENSEMVKLHISSRYEGLI